MAVTINGTTGDSNTTLPGINWQSSIVTAATLTAVGNRGYWIDTTSNACTVTLPASASAGDELVFTDYARTWGVNNVTVNQNSLKYQAETTPNPVWSTDGQSVALVYSGATKGWIPNHDAAVAYGVRVAYSADMLIIAGGGGGESYGGAGAGGYRTSTQTLSPGTIYTVAVGAGGTSAGYGADSQISGASLTTITSTGGSRGSNNAAVGGVGGSGGGGGYGSAGGAGNTPSTSPSQGNNGGAGGDASTLFIGGGGGGAGAVGQAGQAQIGGAGGAGTASSITGSAVTRAGGGGGGHRFGSGGNAAGGSGGGGTGGKNGSGETAGTINTGGGAGGSGVNTAPFVFGGSGVVILSVPDISYSGITTGFPTVARGVSGKTIITFTGSGTYSG
jgi:hypothetical protein